ncbi:hypothetical protein R0381_000628 [Jeongeupia wiesaeckerbachi]|uniref:hypothetical protein n=1 Tax=Jeongeupia wiesaeckerbachi TaxID=3051218 RepID=UPI003D809E64
MDKRYRKRMAAYWAREERKSLASLSRLNYATWFDLWHTHPDWKAKGNRCAENRAAVAAQTYKLLKQAERLASTSGQTIQIFATVCEDTGNNAVYLHTKNPKGTAYPQAFSGAQWGVAVPAELIGVMDCDTHEIGKMVYSDAVEYIIRLRQPQQ